MPVKSPPVVSLKEFPKFYPEPSSCIIQLFIPLTFGVERFSTMSCTAIVKPKLGQFHYDCVHDHEVVIEYYGTYP